MSTSYAAAVASRPVLVADGSVHASASTGTAMGQRTQPSIWANAPSTPKAATEAAAVEARPSP